MEKDKANLCDTIILIEMLRLGKHAIKHGKSSSPYLVKI